MNSKECLEWLKDNYIYLIKEYYNKSLEMKQCVIDMANPKFFTIKEDLDRLEKLEKVNDFIKENLHIDFYHTKHSKEYTIQLGNTMIAVSKETYYELQEVLGNEKE